MMSSLFKNTTVPVVLIGSLFLFFGLLQSGLPRALIYLAFIFIVIVFLIILCVKIYINGLKTKYELEALKSNAVSTKNEILASEAKILKRISLLDPKGPERNPSEALLTMRKEIAFSEAKIIEKITELNKKEFENFPIYSN